MALTLAQVLAQIKRRLPTFYEIIEPHLAGMAAQGALAREAAEDTAECVSIGGAEDEWLTLLACGYGIERVEGESNASLRNRLRNVEDALTRPSIETAVNRILTEAGVGPCHINEWWDGSSAWCDQDYADQCVTSDWFMVFTVWVPLIGTHPGVGHFADQTDASAESYSDVDAYATDDGTAFAYYDIIIEEVERIRAAGVRWWLIVDHESWFV